MQNLDATWILYLFVCSEDDRVEDEDEDHELHSRTAALNYLLDR